MVNKFNLNGFKKIYSDNDSCLEWLKDQIYPDGIKCRVCGKFTKHSKVTNRPCYVCNQCSNQTYPMVGTIFEKSFIPLKTWFEVIHRILDNKTRITAKDIQREYGMTYKTAWRMVHRIRGLFRENQSKTLDREKIKKRRVIKPQESRRVVLILKNEPNSPIINNVPNTGSNQDNNIIQSYQKRDRTARLLKLQIILSQHPQGLPAEEIASRCSVSKRTIYRDLKALESELGVPIWEEGTKRGIDEGYFLPPINFTLPEATVLFLAARLIQNYSYLPNSSLASTFMKLNIIVPTPLKEQINNILTYIEKLPKNENNLRNFNILMHAWLSQHQVRIRYQYPEEEKPVESMIDPYFIETSIIGGSIYVLAFCHLKKVIRAFKFERLIGDVIIQKDTFKVPADFNAIEYLSSAWGIHFDNEPETVKLHFKRRIDALVMENRFHPLQSFETQSDGSAIITLKVRDKLHLIYSIMGLGGLVEVLEPQGLRNQIYDTAKVLVNMYAPS